MSKYRPKKALTGACLDKVESKSTYIPLTIKLEPIPKEDIKRLRNNVYPSLMA